MDGGTTWAMKESRLGEAKAGEHFRRFFGAGADVAMNERVGGQGQKTGAARG